MNPAEDTMYDIDDYQPEDNEIVEDIEPDYPTLSDIAEQNSV